MTNNENTEKNYKYLKVIAIILYIVAAALFIAGVCSIVGYALEVVTGTQNALSMKNFFDFEGFVVYEDDLEHVDISGMISGISLIVFGSVCIVVASVLMRMYHKKTIIETSSVKDDNNLFDSVKKSIADQLKAASEKLNPSQTSTDENKEKSEKPKQKIFCAYCGSELDENDKKCPSCGASKKFRK